MRYLPHAAAALLLFALPKVVVAQTITFEGTGDKIAIPNGYAGLNWDNLITGDATTAALNPSGYRNGLVSGIMVAFNGYGHPAAVLQSSSPFTLNSGYFTAAWNDALALTVTGYVGGVATYFSTAVLNTSGPQLLTFDWGNLDRVDFASAGGVPHPGYDQGAGTHFVLDDLTINQAVTATPEPASVVLLATGLVGVFGVARRRRSTKDLA